MCSSSCTSSESVSSNLRGCTKAPSGHVPWDGPAHPKCYPTIDAVRVHHRLAYSANLRAKVRSPPRDNLLARDGARSASRSSKAREAVATGLSDFAVSLISTTSSADPPCVRNASASYCGGASAFTNLASSLRNTTNKAAPPRWTSWPAARAARSSAASELFRDFGISHALRRGRLLGRCGAGGGGAWTRIGTPGAGLAGREVPEGRLALHMWW